MKRKHNRGGGQDVEKLKDRINKMILEPSEHCKIRQEERKISDGEMFKTIRQGEIIDANNSRIVIAYRRSRKQVLITIIEPETEKTGKILTTYATNRGRYINKI